MTALTLVRNGASSHVGQFVLARFTSSALLDPVPPLPPSLLGHSTPFVFVGEALQPLHLFFILPTANFAPPASLPECRASMLLHALFPSLGPLPLPRFLR